MEELPGEKEYFKGLNQVKYKGPENDNRWHFAGAMRWSPEMKKYF